MPIITFVTVKTLNALYTVITYNYNKLFISWRLLPYFVYCYGRLQAMMARSKKGLDGLKTLSTE